jgi:hypothetical protein
MKMETDYTELSDKQLQERIAKCESHIADAVVGRDSFVISNQLMVRGDLQRELKRRNLKEDES